MERKTKGIYQKRGNPYLRGKTWTFYYYELLPDGKKKARYKGGFPTKQAALAAKREKSPEVKLLDTPLKEILSKWFDDVYIHKVERNTWNIYAIVLHQHILPKLDNSMKLTELTAGDLNQLLSEIHHSGRKSYALKAKELFSTFFNHALNEGLIIKSPMLDVRPPRHTKRKPVILLPEQISKFLTEAKNTSCYLEISLGLLMGLTKGELYGLQHVDVDLNQRTLHIQRVNIMNEGIPLTKTVSTPQNRVLHIPQFLISEFKQRQADNLALKNLHFPRCEYNDYISMRKDGAIRAGSHINSALKRITKKLGWKTMSVQDLRENAINLFQFSGIDQITVSAILGHTSLKTTLQHYRNIRSASQHVSNLFDERFGETFGA